VIQSLEKTIRREQKLRVFAALVLLLAVLIIVFTIDGLLLSSLLAFVLAYLMSPGVLMLERFKVPKDLAIVIVFLFVGAIVGFALSSLFPLLVDQFNSLINNLPKYIEGIRTIIGKSEQKINHMITIYNINVSARAGDYLTNQTNLILENLPSIATKTFTVLLLAPFFAFFLLRDGSRLSRSLLKVIPNNLFEMSLLLSHQINEQMGGFIRARLLEAGIVGGVVWIGLVCLGFPYATFLAIFAGLTNLIPYLGPIVGAIPAFLIAFINKDPNSVVLLLASIYFVAQLIDMLIVIPMVVAKIVDLHPITVIVSIIIGSETMGILGMIISIPVASVLKLIFNTIFERLVTFKTS
jgi:putative permease